MSLKKNNIIKMEFLSNKRNYLDSRLYNYIQFINIFIQ